jgi:hypothetical protein
MEVTVAQYEALQTLFPGCSVDCISQPSFVTILVSRPSS